jgi:predicted CXXCH cytochrome family protein
MTGRSTTLVLTFLGTALALACAELEKDRPPVIVTAGPHSLVAGQTIQITASTRDGVDTGYTWESQNPAAATVSGAGVVTGVAPGEASIVVKGATTGAAGIHVVVVLPPPADLAAEVPFWRAWQSSAHADATSPSFTNWDQEGSVPVACARCHSGEGFQDYLGADGSVPGKVDKPAPTGSPIRCTTCHNAAAEALTEVTLPSGVTVSAAPADARCMTCHQGRASGKDVDVIIAAAAVQGPDQASPALRFLNIHYYPAAATLLGGQGQGGYQYAGRTYDVRFRHATGFDRCTGCHDPHSAKPRFDACVACHPGVTNAIAARDIRMISSQSRDYDGDGDTTEGIWHELEGLRTKLLAAVTTYGREKGTPVCYGSSSFPYWFVDKDADGACAPAEISAANAFASWTPRLVRAAYNYQMASKDPGAFAHNAKYVMELLHDAIFDLNTALARKVDMSKAVRGDRGHFDGSSRASRNWDNDEEVNATCARCHSGAEGFRLFAELGVNRTVPATANGLECETCHTTLGDKYQVLTVARTVFPGNLTRAEPGHDNLCGTCHSGRESKATIDAAISDGRLGFRNVHYLPAAGVKLGSGAKLGYEYPGRDYAGPLVHSGGVQCTSCHDPVASRHTFLVRDAWDARCKTCHADANGQPEAIRATHRLDYDGDGNATESLAEEIQGMAARVLSAMQAAAGTEGLCYEPHTFPYFFKDSDKDRKPLCSPAEASAANRFTAWTAALMKAAHNFQISQKDPGAWAHNFDYMAQLLYDSVADLGGSVAGMSRP